MDGQATRTLMRRRKRLRSGLYIVTTYTKQRFKDYQYSRGARGSATSSLDAEVLQGPNAMLAYGLATTYPHGNSSTFLLLKSSRWA